MTGIYKGDCSASVTRTVLGVFVPCKPGVTILTIPRMCLTSLFCLTFQGPVLAGVIADAGAVVDAALATGDFDAWYDANQALLDTAWYAAGLNFDSLIIVKAPAQGFGGYEARGNNVFAPGEEINIYAEPKGYGFGDLGDGKYEIAFAIDMKVMTPDGSEVANMPDFAELKLASFGQPHEFVANVTITLTGAPAGDYALELTFRDLHGGQSADFTMRVSIQ